MKELSLSAAVLDYKWCEEQHKASRKDGVQIAAVRELKKLAASWGLSAADYDLRYNPGGPAVSGEIILHTETVYVQVSADAGQVLYRYCAGRKDYSGGDNYWVAFDKLTAILPLRHAPEQKGRKKMQGLHEYRFENNPEEKNFAEAWAKENEGPTGPLATGPTALAHLLGNGVGPAEVSDRDHAVAATLMQWLGSPVGQGFLRNLGYEKARVVEELKGSPVYCNPGKPCPMMMRVLEETDKFATARRGAGLEAFITPSGASGIAYRTGGRQGASLLLLNNCPWCGGNPTKEAPKPLASTTPKKKKEKL